MHAPLASNVEPWRAAAAGRVLRGELEPDRVPRLEAIAPPCGPLVVTVSFRDERDAPARLELEVEGRYAVTCQRCLQPLELERRDRSTLRLAADEDGARELDGRDEVLVCAPGEMLDLAALVEDEVLLALPFAPCHAPGDCDAGWRPAPPAGGDDEDVRAGRPNPFAALAALRKEQDRGPDKGQDEDC